MLIQHQPTILSQNFHPTSNIQNISSPPKQNITKQKQNETNLIQNPILFQPPPKIQRNILISSPQKIRRPRAQTKGFSTKTVEELDPWVGHNGPTSLHQQKVHAWPKKIFFWLRSSSPANPKGPQENKTSHAPPKNKNKPPFFKPKNVPS